MKEVYGGYVYPLVFLHYCRRGNSGFQHADKPIRAIFDKTEHIMLTHVSSAIAVFLLVPIGLYFTLRLLDFVWKPFLHVPLYKSEFVNTLKP